MRLFHAFLHVCVERSMSTLGYSRGKLSESLAFRVLSGAIEECH